MTSLPGGRDLLAYLFWHWPRSGVAPEEYERRQRAFHAALAAWPAEGFVSSLSLQVTGAPWAASGQAAYEDWYLVRDFAALGALNDAAASGSRAPSHDRAAASAASGAGGVYRLRQGAPLAQPARAYWLDKPEGVTYSEFFQRVSPHVQQMQGALWMRQMVLGPAREFCVHVPTTADGLVGVHALRIDMRRVWPPADA